MRRRLIPYKTESNLKNRFSRLDSSRIFLASYTKIRSLLTCTCPKLIDLIGHVLKLHKIEI